MAHPKKNQALKTGSSPRTTGTSRGRKNTSLVETALQAAAQAAQEGIVVYDCALRYQFWNPYMEAATGVPAADVIGRNALTVFPQLAATGLPECWTQVMEGRGSAELEFSLPHPKTGEALRLSDTITPLRDAAGTLIGLVSIVRNLTAERRSEQARREHESRFQLIADNTSDIIWLLNRDSMRFSFVSASVLKHRGYTPAEAMQQTLQEMLPPDSYARLMAQLQERLASFAAGDLSQRTGTVVADLLRKDGRYIPTETVITLLTDSTGRVSEILGITRDISSRLAAEPQSRAGNYLLEKLFSASPTPFCLVRDSSGEVVKVNDSFLRLFGYTRDEVIGKTTVELRLWHEPAQRDAVRQRLLERRVLPPTEVQFRNRLGAVGYLQLSAELVHDDKEQYLLSALADVTDQKKAEKINRSLRAMALLSGGADQIPLCRELCLKAAIDGGGFDAAGLYQMDEATQNLVLQQQRGYPAGNPREAGALIPPAILQSITQLRMTFFGRPSALGLPESLTLQGEPVRLVGVLPMVLEAQLVGCLCVMASRIDQVSDIVTQALESLAADFAATLANLRAKESLRSEKLHLSNLIESTQAGTWEWDIVTGETKFNETWAQMIGYSLAELGPTTIATWERFAHPEDRARTRELLLPHLAGEVPYFENECRLRHKQGHWVWVLDRGRVVRRSAGGEPLVMMGAHVDVTRLKLAEVAVRESEERHKLALLGAQMTAFEWKVGTDELVWPAGHQGIFPAELTSVLHGGSSLLSLVHPKDRLGLQAALLDESKAGAGFEHEFRTIRPDGSVRWVFASGRALLNAEGQTAKLLGVLRDITPRKEAEFLIATKDREFRAIFEVASIGMAQADPHTGQLLRVNERMCEITGLSQEALLRRRVADITHPDDRAADWNLFQSVVRGERSHYQIEKRYLRPDDSTVWASVNMTVIRNPDGTPLRAVATIEDVTKRKSEELLQAARHRLLEFASAHSVEELLVATLDEAEILTGSQVGFYHFLNADQATLSLQAWSTRTSREMCQAEGKGRHYHLEEAGVWADCVRERRPVVHNDYASLPNRRGLPAGHAPVAREMVVPIFRNNLIVAILGVGNKRQPYTQEDIDTVARLADLAWDVVELRRTEMALFESERRLRLFVQQAPVALAMLDHDMCYIDYSQRWIEGFGLQHTDLRGKSHYELFPQFSAEKRAIFARALAGETIHANEVRYRRPDGTHRWLHWEVCPWQSNGVRGIVIFSEDITSRKQAEDTIREHEARYRALVEASPDWIWEIDAAGRYTYASPRVTALLGYEQDAVLGATPFDFVPPREAERIRPRFDECLQQSHAPIVGLEITFRHKDGRAVAMETNATPIFSSAGVFSGYRGLGRDITNRLASETRIRLLGAALEAAANAIVITDAQGTIEWANPAFTAASGWGRDEAIGRNPRELVKSGQHDAEYYEKMWRTISAGKVWQGEIVNRRKDGALRTEDMTITPLCDANGKITHFIAIKQDITERKQFESNIRQAQRIESLGTLAGGIAHDLNNILTPIMVGCNMVLESNVDPSTQEVLMMMRDGAERGASIIRQLLTYGRGIDGERTLLEVRPVLKEILTIMRETFPRDIAINLEIADDVPPLKADPTQLHQLMLNLCVNARDAMPGGGTLSIRARRTELDGQLPQLTQPGSYVQIEIEDSGVGIPPEIKDRIFDPFFTTKPVDKGTGLGLSTAIGIARNHGGALTVDSTLGQGSTFTIYLPATAEDGAPKTETAVEAPRVQGRGELILVADDEHNIREFVRILLVRQGYRTIVAADGQEGLALYLANQAHVRLLLTDIMMPMTNGLQLIRQVRQLAPALPVIAMTGLGDSSYRQELAEMGIPEFIQKPFDREVLLRMVAEKLVGPSA